MLFFIDPKEDMKTYLFCDGGSLMEASFDVVHESDAWGFWPENDRSKFVANVFNHVLNTSLTCLRQCFCYTVQTDEILQYSQNITFVETIKSFPLKSTMSHTLDDWYHKINVIVGDCDNFDGRPSWDSSAVSLQHRQEDIKNPIFSFIYWEDVYDHGSVPEEDYYLLKLMFDSNDNEDIESSNKTFYIYRVCICKRSYH